jgi:beclin 1
MRDIEARAKRGLFPSDATDNVQHKEAALLNSQCTMAMSLLCPLTRKLLSSKTSPVHLRWFSTNMS